MATQGSSHGQFSIQEKCGDLFQSKCSLAHCVSQDLKMFLGIAITFRKNFGRVNQLEKQCKKVGQVAILKVDGRFIYNLITKEKYNGKPTYDTLKQSLIKMKEHMVSKSVKEVSMPKIGCGLDLLKWELVKPIIEDVFQDSKIKITIFYMSKEEARELEDKVVLPK